MHLHHIVETPNKFRVMYTQYVHHNQQPEVYILENKSRSLEPYVAVRELGIEFRQGSKEIGYEKVSQQLEDYGREENYLD